MSTFTDHNIYHLLFGPHFLHPVKTSAVFPTFSSRGWRRLPHLSLECHRDNAAASKAFSLQHNSVLCLDTHVHFTEESIWRQRWRYCRKDTCASSSLAFLLTSSYVNFCCAEKKKTREECVCAGWTRLFNASSLLCYFEELEKKMVRIFLGIGFVCLLRFFLKRAGTPLRWLPSSPLMWRNETFHWFCCAYCPIWLISRLCVCGHQIKDGIVFLQHRWYCVLPSLRTPVFLINEWNRSRSKPLTYLLTSSSTDLSAGGGLRAGAGELRKQKRSQISVLRRIWVWMERWNWEGFPLPRPP